MTHRKEILKRTDIPAGAEEQARRLDALADSFYKLREDKQARQQPVDRLNDDYDVLNDLTLNLDVSQGAPDALEGCGTYGIASDPLTRLKFARDYGVLDKDVANDLQRRFHDAVKAITGIRLTDQEVKRLHKLMTGYNPFQP